jgi:hypothetical protein
LKGVRREAKVGGGEERRVEMSDDWMSIVI